jgi:hypothetical protein
MVGEEIKSEELLDIKLVYGYNKKQRLYERSFCNVGNTGLFGSKPVGRPNGGGFSHTYPSPKESHKNGFDSGGASGGAALSAPQSRRGLPIPSSETSKTSLPLYP